MKTFALLALLALPCALYAAPETRSLKGVTMPVYMDLAGVKLQLNGMGLRTKVVFKVYVGGLYLEKTSKDGMEIASSEQVKRMELVFLRSVSGADVAKAIAEGFAANAGDSLPALKERIDAFRKLIPDVKKGDKLTFTYLPGKGLEVEAGGKPAGVIQGKDFADALMRVWLGQKPADKDLKAGLLGL